MAGSYSGHILREMVEYMDDFVIYDCFWLVVVAVLDMVGGLPLFLM